MGLMNSRMMKKRNPVQGLRTSKSANERTVRGKNGLKAVFCILAVHINYKRHGVYNDHVFFPPASGSAFHTSSKICLIAFAMSLFSIMTACLSCGAENVT